MQRHAGHRPAHRDMVTPDFLDAVVRATPVAHHDTSLSPPCWTRSLNFAASVCHPATFATLLVAGGAVLSIVGVVVLAVNFDSPVGLGLSLGMMILGLILVIVGKVGAWWDHG